MVITPKASTSNFTLKLGPAHISLSLFQVEMAALNARVEEDRAALNVTRSLIMQGIEGIVAKLRRRGLSPPEGTR